MGSLIISFLCGLLSAECVWKICRWLMAPVTLQITQRESLLVLPTKNIWIQFLSCLLPSFFFSILPFFFIFISHAFFFFSSFCFLFFVHRNICTLKKPLISRSHHSKRGCQYAINICQYAWKDVWKEGKGRDCLEQWFPKGGSWTSHISIICKLVTNANFQASSEPYWVSNSECGAHQPAREFCILKLGTTGLRKDKGEVKVAG